MAQIRRHIAILRSSVFCAVLILVFASATAQESRKKQVFDQVDAYLNQEAQTHFFRGAVLVGMDGKVQFEKSYGSANGEWETPNAPTTKFRIASLTKQFTAACILLLQERGRLNVNEPVSQYLPGLPDVASHYDPSTIDSHFRHTELYE